MCMCVYICVYMCMDIRKQCTIFAYSLLMYIPYAYIVWKHMSPLLHGAFYLLVLILRRMTIM